MSISLNGLKPKDTYQALIKVGDNTIVTTVNKTLSDGQGNDLPIQVSTLEVNFTGLVKQSGITLATTTQLNLKQDTLVSGTNIKTINGSSILGSGNLLISGASAIWGAITGTLSAQTDLQTALDSKVDENTAIVGATKTKVTYDSKGLVTSGADATTSDIADSTNKRYVTDANLVVIGNTSGTNSGDNAVNSLYSGLAASKQDTLVSGTNIKTVNGNSLLGSGDVVISTSTAWGGITGTLSSQTDLQTALNGKVSTNTAITGATKTKITYDAKGLVTAGADLVLADIPLDARTQSFVIACSDETTAITTGTAKVTFRIPYAFTLLSVRASLTVAQTSGTIFTVDINENGTSILSTKLTIDNTEKTSTTAATPPVISDSSLADDSEITIDVDQIGDGTAKGLKVVLIGYKS